jgi:hypothetical protein
MQLKELTQEKLDVLSKRYEDIIVLANQKENTPEFLLALDFAITYIKENHKEATQDQAGWAIVVVKKDYIGRDEEFIKKEIDDFINNYQENYEKYKTEIVMSTNEFDLQTSFVFHYSQARVH